MAQAARAPSSAAARSGGSSERASMRSPVIGWVKERRWEWRNWRSRPYLHRPPVGLVADQRVADGGEVGADLVGAAGLELRLEVGLGSEQLEHLEMGPRVARRCPRYRHPVAPARGAPDRGVDRSGARTHPALRERKVDPLHLAAPDLLLQRPVGLVGAGDDHQAAGPSVEAMNDSRALGILAAREQVAELVDQGRPGVRGGRMHDESGGLVDDREMLVAVDYPQGLSHLRRAPSGIPTPAARRRWLSRRRRG